MKKLLSLVLVLAMLASMCVYLPLGVSAAGSTTSETIYAEDFADLADGTYTLEDVAAELGWTLLRGDDATTVTVTNGTLAIDTTNVSTDVVFQMATSEKFKANHTIQYDLVMGSQNTSLKNYKLFFAGVYTGTDNGETVKAIINRTTYEGYNHMALANGSINEGIYSVAGFVLNGGDHAQCRPENVPGGATNNTWKTVIDVTNNQVDAYAAGARMNSTAGAQGDAWAKIKVADYVGTGAYLRVQQGRVATFDNISIVTGGTAVSYGDYAYVQDFSNIPDGTYTGAEMASLTGFQQFKDTLTANGNPIVMTYKIANGRLEFVSAPGEGSSITSGTSAANNYDPNTQGVFGSLFVPEMETAKEGIALEYDMTYLYDSSVAGSFNNGDTPFFVQMFGRRSDFNAHWGFTQKGFLNCGFRNGAGYKVTTENADGTTTTTTCYPNYEGLKSTNSKTFVNVSHRYEYINYNTAGKTYAFTNGSYAHSLIGNTEHIKVVLDYDDGMFIYVNGVVAMQCTEDQLNAWLSTKGTANSNHTDIVGNLFRFLIPVGCHAAIDNVKVTVDPAEIEAPDLWLTEASCGASATGWCSINGAEYIEVYNASNKPINIYDYAVTQRSYAGGNNTNPISMDTIGTAIGLSNITLAYPGTHTFKSIKLAEDGVTPLYTYDVTNPAYADGWIAPGEVCVLWNKTDSMHNGGYSSPSVITDSTKANYGMGNYGHITLDDFRGTLVGMPKDVKVFQMYNDYNRAFNNSGWHLVALVNRKLVQPSYDPATGNGSQTLTNAKIGWSDYESTILDVANSANARTPKTVAYATYDLTEAAGHSEIVFARPNAANTASAMTPGYLTDAQKRTITYTVDGVSASAFLGTEIDYNFDTTNAAYADYKLLFADVNGTIVTAPFVRNVLNGDVINRYKVSMTTLAGASVRTTNKTAGLRWVTALHAEDLETLQAHGAVSNIEFGTLVARPDDLGDAALTLDNTTENGGVVRKVLAYDGMWYTNGETATYEGYNLYAGGVGNMKHANYVKSYCGVGYLTMTVNGTTVTVYGDYVPENHDRQALTIINAAYNDYVDMMNNGETLTEEEEAEFLILEEYLNNYNGN